MAFMKCCVSVLLLTAVCFGSEKPEENEVVRAVRTGDDLVTAVTQDCITGDESVMTCLRHKVLSYVNNLVGIQNEFEGRSLSDGKMDEVIARRLKKYFNSHEFKIQLPKFLFEEAILTFSPSRGLADFKVDFPEEPKNEERAISEGSLKQGSATFSCIRIKNFIRGFAEDTQKWAVGCRPLSRGHIKKKLLLPLLLLLKLKIKALTPILLVIVGIKAVKAFIMSKLSLLIVIGFMLLQMFKKKGMSMPMSMPVAMATDPPPVYGPPPTSATYGPPAPTPETSYGPWEPTNNSNGNSNANGSPYARWDSHNIVYSAHQPENTVKTAQQLQAGT